MNARVVTATSSDNKASFLELLPPELLHQIFDYVLPHGLTFSFEQSRHAVDDSIWVLLAAREKHTPRAIASKTSIISSGVGQAVHLCGICDDAYNCRYGVGPEDVRMELLYVSKAIAMEARAFIFGKNIFSFHITGSADRPISLKSPRAFGPLGSPHRIHLLRDLRRIELTLTANDLTSWSKARLRARIQYFVDILQEHAEDANKQSLLTQLHIQIRARQRSDRCTRPSSSFRYLRRQESLRDRTVPDTLVFVLEPLASLQGISDITVRGAPEWLKQCLEMRIRGEGGELETLNWPTKTVKRQQKGSRRKIEVEVSTRHGWQPTLDWKQFATRHGIELPEHTYILFPSSQNAGEAVEVISASTDKSVAN